LHGLGIEPVQFFQTTAAGVDPRHGQGHLEIFDEAQAERSTASKRQARERADRFALQVPT